MHQPAWSLFDAVRLAGIQPTRRGFRIAPELPFVAFSLSLPDIGVAYRPHGAHGAHGYVITAESQRLTMQVRPPARAGGGALVARRWRVFVAGHRVADVMRGGLLTFALSARARRAVSLRISPST